MTPTKVLATTERVLNQLRHDPRTIALVVFVPSLVVVLLRYMFNSDVASFDHTAPMLLGIFPLIALFNVAAVAMLRERTSGTLDRMLTLPMAKLDLLLGYALAFGVLILAQASLASLVALGIFKVHVAAGTAAIFLFTILSGLLGMSIGMLLSAFATSEYQANQFLPAFILPQLLLSGFFVSRTHMGFVLRWLSDVLPLTYIIDAMHHITLYSTWDKYLVRDLIVIAGIISATLILAAVSLRRKE